MAAEPNVCPLIRKSAFIEIQVDDRQVVFSLGCFHIKQPGAAYRASHFGMVLALYTLVVKMKR